MEWGEGQLVLSACVHVHVDAKQEQYTFHVLLLDGHMKEVVSLVVVLSGKFELLLANLYESYNSTELQESATFNNLSIIPVQQPWVPCQGWPLQLCCFCVTWQQQRG